MSNYISPADKCRAALKAAGYNRTRVSVRADGGDVQITILVPIPRASIVAAVESVISPRTVYSDGDEFSTKGYSIAYAPALVAPVANVIEARLLSSRGQIVTVLPGCDMSVPAASGWQIHHVDVMSWRGEVGRRVGSRYCCGIRHAAQQLAEDAIDKGWSADALAAYHLRGGVDHSSWLDRLALDDEPTDRPSLSIVR